VQPLIGNAGVVLLVPAEGNGPSLHTLLQRCHTHVTAPPNRSGQGPEACDEGTRARGDRIGANQHHQGLMSLRAACQAARLCHFELEPGSRKSGQTIASQAVLRGMWEYVLAGTRRSQRPLYHPGTEKTAADQSGDPTLQGKDQVVGDPKAILEHQLQISKKPRVKHLEGDQPTAVPECFGE
ncbi:hypothetical protein DFJ73DRAFT_846339, partial [Zopfochytrium polystomum]